MLLSLAQWLQGEGADDVDVNDVFEASNVEQSASGESSEEDEEEDELQSDN